jgi:hypothetical protein
MVTRERTRMSIIQLRCEVPEGSIEIIVRLRRQTISEIASERVGKVLTAYSVEFIRWICARMSVVDS